MLIATYTTTDPSVPERARIVGLMLNSQKQPIPMFFVGSSEAAVRHDIQRYRVEEYDWNRKRHMRAIHAKARRDVEAKKRSIRQALPPLYQGEGI